MPADARQRLRTSCYGAVVDRMAVNERWYSSARAIVPSVVEDVVRDFGRYDQKCRICWRVLEELSNGESFASLHSTHFIVFVNLRNAPALLRVLGTDA